MVWRIGRVTGAGALVGVAASLACSWAIAGQPGGGGDTGRIPPDAASLHYSFAPIVRHAAPAVVNVYSRRLVRQQLDPFWTLFSGGMARDRVEQSLGSGSIVRADGVVLTNHHNIAGAQEIQVVTADRREWPATVLLDDSHADLAVLKIDTKGERLPTIAINNASAPQVGDLVLAIGNPFGVGQTVTNGIVSAVARSDVTTNDYSYFLQTDAAINPGNSGGPLVDMNGDLIGVNTAIVSSSGASAGVGFAIPASIARQVVDAAFKGDHTVTRPWIGAKGQALTDEMAKSFGLASPRGVVVTDIWTGGAADRAGIVRGDVITAVGDDQIDDPAGLTYHIGARRPGEDVSVRIWRNGQARTLRVTIETPPDSPPADKRVIAGRSPLSGATVINLSPASAQQYGGDPFASRGVMVVDVGAGFAHNIGVQPGDLIREVNGHKIATTADLVEATARDSLGWSLVIQRGGQIITARFAG